MPPVDRQRYAYPAHRMSWWPRNWKKRRFLTTEQATEELNVSSNQIRALLKTGELRAIQVGGGGTLRHSSHRPGPDGNRQTAGWNRTLAI